MTVGNFNRANLEATATSLASDFLSVFERAERLRNRCQAELSSGTFAAPDFYGSDAADQGSVLGMLDDIHAVWLAVQNAQALPAKDYRLYLNHLVGI